MKTEDAAGFILRSCPLCGEDREAVLFDTRDYNQGFAGSFRFVRCRSCDLIYQNPCARGAALMALYPRTYVTPALYSRRALEQRIALPVHGVRARKIEQYLQGGAFFEIGCGGGLFAKFMERRGWSVSGIDASLENVDYARRRLGLLGIEHAQWPPESGLPQGADVVAMIHLLEHLHDPVQALQAARRMIRRGGLLVVETPNTESWPFRLFGRRAFMVEAPRHLSLFSSSTLDECARRAGFEVCEMITFSPSTLEYSESLRFCLEHLGLRRAEKRGAGPEAPPPASGAASSPGDGCPWTAAKGVIHLIENRVCAAVNALADRRGAGNNLLMIARPIGIPEPR